MSGGYLSGWAGICLLGWSWSCSGGISRQSRMRSTIMAAYRGRSCDRDAAAGLRIYRLPRDLRTGLKLALRTGLIWQVDRGPAWLW